MFDEYHYRVELHAHTKPASHCGQMTSDELVKRYAAVGCHALAITNHFMFCEQDAENYVDCYLRDFTLAQEAGKKYGMTILLGAEIRFSGNDNDYLIFGIDREDLIRIYPMLSGNVRDFYPQFHNDRNVIIQAHPYRGAHADLFPDALDGAEVFNLHPNHNPAMAWAAAFAEAQDHARSQGFIISCGSDCHTEDVVGMGFTMTRSLPADTFALADILKKHDYIMNVAGNLIIPENSTALHE